MQKIWNRVLVQNQHTRELINNNNNRLFMATHLARAQSTRKDIRTHSFHHTHTHTHTQHTHNTHTRTHARTHVRTHAHTRTHTHEAHLK